MNIPDNLKYTKNHEWIKIGDNAITIGITDYAQSQLGDIVFVELPDEGEELAKDDTFGAVESVKSVSDCFAPLDGIVLEKNDLLENSPEIMNEDCYGEGWMLKIEIDGDFDESGTMDAAAYQAFVNEES